MRVRGGGGLERGGVLSRGNSVGYRQILFQLVVKKLLLTFWKVKHCKGGRGGGVRRSAAQKQQKAQVAAKTAAKSSNKWQRNS